MAIATAKPISPSQVGAVSPIFDEVGGVGWAAAWFTLNPTVDESDGIGADDTAAGGEVVSAGVGASTNGAAASALATLKLTLD